MKYKLYYIKDQNHQYYNEIRGVRFDYQYQRLPDCAEYIKKEYDSDKDPIPKLFFQEENKDINFAQYKANPDFTDIVKITPTELINNPRYQKEKKEKQLKQNLEKALAKNKRLEKITELEKIKISNPDLAIHAQAEIDKLKAEESKNIGEL
jgi:hypothetical protein